MTTKGSASTEEAQIRQRLESWARALRAKDLVRLMSHYTQDILVFDLAPHCNIREPSLIERTGRIGSPRSKGRLAMRFAT
jgi:ketosteroid isomerase-like protein